MAQEVSNGRKKPDETLPPFARQLFADLLARLGDEASASSFLSGERAASLREALALERVRLEHVRHELSPLTASSPSGEEEGRDGAEPMRAALDGALPSLTRLALLLDAMADTLARDLAQECGLALDLVSYLVAEARRATLGKYLEEADDERLVAYFEELKRQGKLNSDVLLEHARKGASTVFFAAVAVAADLRLDVEMVAAFIEDGGSEILERLLLRTDLIEPARQAVLAIYEEAAGGSS